MFILPYSELAAPATTHTVLIGSGARDGADIFGCVDADDLSHKAGILRINKDG